MLSLKKALVISFVALGFLSACEGEGTYPVSGQSVGQDDPVQALHDPSSTLFRGGLR